MNRLLQVFQILIQFVLLPFYVLNGGKKRAYRRIKKMMIAANLL